MTCTFFYSASSLDLHLPDVSPLLFLACVDTLPTFLPPPMSLSIICTLLPPNSMPSDLPIDPICPKLDPTQGVIQCMLYSILAQLWAAHVNDIGCIKSAAPVQIVLDPSKPLLQIPQCPLSQLLKQVLRLLLLPCSSRAS